MLEKKSDRLNFLTLHPLWRQFPRVSLFQLPSLTSCFTGTRGPGRCRSHFPDSFANWLQGRTLQGEWAWRREMDFLPHFCSCHCCYSNNGLHLGATVASWVHILMVLQNPSHNVLKQVSATASRCPFSQTWGLTLKGLPSGLQRHQHGWAACPLLWGLRTAGVRPWLLASSILLSHWGVMPTACSCLWVPSAFSLNKSWCKSPL